MIFKTFLAMVLATLGALPLAAQNKGQGFDPTQAWAQLQQQLLQQFDRNQDGKLTGDEQLKAQEFLRRQGVNSGMPPGGFPGAEEFNKQFDRNRNGKLEPAEAAAAQAAFQRMRSGGSKGGVGGGVQKGSVPGPQYDPAATGEQKDSKVPPLVKRFDKDGDGKLNAEEKAAAQAEFKKSKSKDGKEKDGKDDKDKDKDGKAGKG
jgi:hypothetical protein